MSNLIMQLIGFAALAHLIVDFIVTLDKDWIPAKPFKCDKCFAFWLSIAPMLIQFGIIGVLYSACIAILAQIIFKYTV